MKVTDRCCSQRERISGNWAHRLILCGAEGAREAQLTPRRRRGRRRNMRQGCGREGGPPSGAGKQANGKAVSAFVGPFRSMFVLALVFNPVLDTSLLLF
jgi:hypothetical protein